MIEAQVNKAQVLATQQRLTRLLGKMRDRTAPNREVSIQLYGWAASNFDNEGRSVSIGMGGASVRAWAPLAASTIREKERLGKQQMLVRTGKMRGSFEPFYSAENAGLRNTDEKAEFFQFGTRKMPARELLPPREVVDQIGLRVYNEYVKRVVAEAGGNS